MKKRLLTICLSGLVALGLAGCAANSGGASSSSKSSSESSASSTTTQSTTSSSTHDSQKSSIVSHHQRAVKVTYTNLSDTARLDDEYREEHLYQSVPGTVKQNRIYQWDAQNVSDHQTVYIDKKAVATFKDDDDQNEYDHEDFYRIAFSKHATHHYWVNDDVIDHDLHHDNDIDD
ncbi:hypothetical protein [Lentilactobacillus parafarraginis]|uniref:hypothetical protein n=1 Tax=Lentilactobacillus parafarraginis TaxID=390842 RepID=UPI0002E64461|nr:hypothetical protein [Lentilactobacillus parafarraginis]